jgi:hypothetical protein
MGVPFINPIQSWNKEMPLDRYQWSTQHDGLRLFNPPYVYHVFAKDTDAFVHAVNEAIKHPIER